VIAKILLALAAAAAAALTTRWVAGGLIPTTKVVRRNYRGVPVPTGLGVAVLVGISAGMGLVAFVHAIDPDAQTPTIALFGALAVLLTGFGFGLLGLYDDIAEQPDRGWRAHLPALVRGRVTPGSLKIVGGGVIAFVFGASGATSFGWAVVHAATIALMANLFNALDVRPGRAGKFFILGGVPLAILGKFMTVPMSAVLGAVAAFLTFDLRERAMLGDAGSNAIGAILGGAVVAIDPPSLFQIVLLAFLVVLNTVAEGPTLSAWIDRIGPLRSFDRALRAETHDVSPSSD
jgi:UDP-N-acetylmuramyl pentapeptide phosphotransferase/UDP-N-acetylglucosamine-1-phosphate transferase